MRAVSKDFDTARLMGIKVNSVITVTFIIGSFLAGVGSILYFTNYGQVSPTIGAMPGLKAFVAAVFGGIGSVTGSVIGSFLYIACSEWWLRFLDDSQTYLGVNIPFMRGGFRMVVFSVVIMLVVLFYRQGIMGTREFSWQAIIDFFKKPFAKRERKAAKDNG